MIALGVIIGIIVILAFAAISYKNIKNGSVQTPC